MSWAALPLVLCMLWFFTSALLAPVIPMTWSVLRESAPMRWEWGRLLMGEVHAVAYFLAAAGLGGRLARFFRLQIGAMSTGLVMATACGLGVIGLAVLGFSLAGLAEVFFLRLFYLTLIVVALPGTIRSARCWSNVRLRVDLRWITIIAIVAAGWCALWSVGDLLAPEGFWDAIVYHLGVPARILEHHKYVHMPPFFSNLPLLMSMHYLMALAIRGEDLARGIALGTGVCLIWSAWRIGRRWLTREDALLAAVVAATLPLAGALYSHANSDVGATMFGLLSLYALSEASSGWPRRRPKEAWVVAAGMLAGLSGGAKMPGLFAVAAASICLLPHWMDAAKCLTAAGMVYLAWLLKSWLVTGDPLFPFGAEFFNSPFWGEFSRGAYGSELRSIWLQLSPGDFLPWGYSNSFISRYKLGLFGPMPALVALAVVSFKTPPLLRQPLIYVSATTVFWAFTVPAYRFNLGVFLLLPGILAVLAGRWRRPLLAAAVGLNMVWYPVVVDILDSPWRSAQGEEAREDYYVRHHVNSSLDAFEFLNERARLKPGYRILAVGEVRNYLAPPHAVVPSLFEPAILLDYSVGAPTPERLFLRLRQHGIRYLVIDVPELIRMRVKEHLCWSGPVPVESLTAFFREHTSLVYARSGSWIYELSPRGRGAELPECFLAPDRLGTLGGYNLASLAQLRASTGQVAEALRYGWAAVAMAPRSGLAWASLGDALYLNRSWDQAIGAYTQAMYYNWKTSVVYRNQAMALAQQHHIPAAQRGLMLARRIDPDSRTLQEDTIGLWSNWLKRDGGGRVAQ